jgi:hypothetical protein
VAVVATVLIWSLTNCWRREVDDMAWLVRLVDIVVNGGVRCSLLI